MQSIFRFAILIEMEKIYLKNDILQEIRAKIGKGENQQSQKKVAQNLGVCDSTLSRFLNGHEGVYTIAEKLGYTVEPAFTKEEK